MPMAETHAILPYAVEPLVPTTLQALEHFLMNDDNNDNNNFPIHDQHSVEEDPKFINHPSEPIIEDGFGFQMNIKPSEFGKPINLSSWPMKVPPYTCSCCQVLREITHTNGVEITKLEIHGRLGVICHAVLDKYRVDQTKTNRNHEYKMFDFCKESIRRVKQFLVEYCMEQKQKAYKMLQDPLSSFYEAVCVGLDWEDSKVVTDDHVRKDSGDHHISHLPNGQSSRSATSVNKTALSIQRDRTRKLTVRDFVGYFHLPIEVAGKKIQVSPTVIKKICRKHGLSRWPCKQIRSVQKKIFTRTRKLTCMEAEERGRAQAEIDRLQQEITDIYSRF